MKLNAFQPKHLGLQMAENILINTVIPVLFAYGSYSKEESIKKKPFNGYMNYHQSRTRLPGNGRIGIGHRSALDSQALIELTNQYCVNKRCLDCAVGNRILKITSRKKAVIQYLVSVVRY
jgi:hypothetical protein